MTDDDQEIEVALEPNQVNTLQPDWKNAPKVSDLQGDYIEAKSDHDVHVNNVAYWLDHLNITGSAKVNPPKGRSRVQPKLVRKQAEWSYSSLSEPFLSTTNLFDIKPTSAGDKERAEQNKLILNNQFNTKVDIVAFIDEFVRADVDEGTLYIYTGWNFEEEEYEEEEPTFELQPVITQAEFDETSQLIQMYQQDPETFKINQPDLLTQVVEVSLQNQTPMKAVITEINMVTKTRTLANHPDPEILDYRSCIPDPTCDGNIEKAGFMIRIFESSLSGLKKDGIYSNLDEIKPVSHKASSDYPDEAEPTFAFKDEPRQKLDVIEYWGYWDIHGTGEVTGIVCSWVGDVMIRLEENPTPDGSLPFVSCQLLPVRKSNYGQPNAELIIDNQSIIGATTRGMVDLMGKAANAQVGSAKDALDPINQAKFKRGESYEYNPNSDPTRAFYMHKFPEIPNSAMLMNQVMTADAQELTGIRPFAQSQTGSVGGDTAAGVRTADDATTKRESGMLRRMSNCLIKMARKYIAMNAVFLTEDEVIRITNDKFVAVRTDDLAGNFDIKITISTAEADNSKAQELAFMLQTTGQTMGPEFSQIIMADIAKLRKMPDLARKIEEFQPQPDPMAQKIQMLEVAKLEAEIAKIQSETVENQANAQLDMAKVGTEQVKQGNLQSDTDLKDLNFVEQESGTTQERDKELVNTQAESMTRKSIIENSLQKPKDSDTTTTNGLESV
jgi:hypothetical protein